MKKAVVVYDDRIKPNKEICAINGGRSFGRTIYKRRMLSDIVKSLVGELIILDEDNEPDLGMLDDNTVVCHMYSSYIVSDAELFDLLLKKAVYAKDNYGVTPENADGDGLPAMLIFSEKEHYLSFLSNNHADADLKLMTSAAFSSIGTQGSFLNFITGGFDARFFNALEGDYYTVTKSSTNKEKIKREFNFYNLLPDDMKHWFVQPYDYREDRDKSSYSMERYHTTDIAIRYVHGAVDKEEMTEILNTLFYFISHRKREKVSYERYAAVRDSLYLNKVLSRVEELKKHPDYDRLKPLLTSVNEGGIDYVIEKYQALYNKNIVQADEKAKGKDYYLCVGHGDLCFSNILFQKDAHLLKLIDPKGAMNEEEMYTDECYDIAKLSHSICGNYDFFNTGLYEIVIGPQMKPMLRLDEADSAARELFAVMLKQQGYDFKRIRLYEASLFLSMLPLHMDNPQKVFGFILNALEILEGEYQL